MASNNNNINNGNSLLTQLIQSDLFKTIITMVFCVVGMTWTVSYSINKVEKSIDELRHSIEITQVKTDDKIKALEVKQERDYKILFDMLVKDNSSSESYKR